RDARRREGVLRPAVHVLAQGELAQDLGGEALLPLVVKAELEVEGPARELLETKRRRVDRLPLAVVAAHAGVEPVAEVVVDAPDEIFPLVEIGEEGERLL